MKTLTKIILALSAITTFIESCKSDPDVLPGKQISFKIPQNWPDPTYTFEGNTLSEAGFELGRKLFFDTRLSRDNSISCGSCHQPFAAFSQFEHDVSHGVDNKLGTRNSPALFNLNWHKGYFWDGGVLHLENQPLNPIQNPVEMDERLENIIAKLSPDADYKVRFKEVFGDENINSQRMFKALAQFMGLLISDSAKYDKYMRGEEGGTMTVAELSGLSIYRSKCASCHIEPLFSDYTYRNNGLIPKSVADSGRARITLDANDMYKFKVPSLRNLKYSSPYMHDGRLRSLEEVLDHYTSGIYITPTLDPLLQSGIALSSQEKSDLIAFLNTLNDEAFVKDSRFQEVK